MNLTHLFSVTNLAIAFAALTYLVALIWYRFYLKKKLEHQVVMNLLISAGMIPVAIAIIISPFFPELGIDFKDFAFQIAICGILLVHHSGALIRSMLPKSSTN